MVTIPVGWKIKMVYSPASDVDKSGARLVKIDDLVRVEEDEDNVEQHSGAARLLAFKPTAEIVEW